MKIDINLARGVITILWFALFVVIWGAAWSRGRKREFDAAAQLPLHEDWTTAVTKEMP
jgi:cbb3-type cytochrome oxidase subunit 3